MSRGNPFLFIGYERLEDLLESHPVLEVDILKNPLYVTDYVKERSAKMGFSVCDGFVEVQSVRGEEVHYCRLGMGSYTKNAGMVFDQDKAERVVGRSKWYVRKIVTLAEERGIPVVHAMVSMPADFISRMGSAEWESAREEALKSEFSD